MSATPTPFPRKSQTPNRRFAALAALMIVGFPLASASAVAIVSGNLLAPNYECSADDDATWWWQDSKATCKFNCRQNDLLTVEVDAVDPDAVASGKAQCGGRTAQCSGSDPATDYCTATSKKPTKEAAVGTCFGTAAEAVPDRVYVTCASEPSSVGCGLLGCEFEEIEGATAIARIAFLENGIVVGTLYTPQSGWQLAPVTCSAHDGLVTCGLGLHAAEESL